jgi:hypothetical protein
MLSRPYRLTERRDFATVYNRRRMAHTEHLTIYWMQDKRGHRRRFGFVTSKKVGKAHDRNLVRRRLRHICANLLTTFIPGDYIFVARPGSPTLSQEMLAQELLAAREKLYARRLQDTQPLTPEAASEPTVTIDATIAKQAETSGVTADAELHEGTPEVLRSVSLPIRLIRAYQMLSRRTPSMCRFYPTCSEYMVQAMLRYGVWQGLWMGMRRIARCHPFSKGGHDPVP